MTGPSRKTTESGVKVEDALLAVSDLHVRYGPVNAVKGISLRVEYQHVVSVLGANGAGKSSLLNSIAGLVRASRGSIEIDGFDVSAETPEARVRRGVALVPEGRRIFPGLTVDQNLRLGASTRTRQESADNRSRIDEIFPELIVKRKSRAGTLSGGQQQMLAIARALMSNPRLLLLDEPSLGLAPIIVDHVFDLIERLRDEGLSIVLVEQNVGRALDLADEAYVLSGGKVVDHGDSEHIRRSGVLHTAYFGEGIAL